MSHFDENLNDEVDGLGRVAVNLLNKNKEKKKVNKTTLGVF